jgi:hypothetical protein
MTYKVSPATGARSDSLKTVRRQLAFSQRAAAATGAEMALHPRKNYGVW